MENFIITINEELVKERIDKVTASFFEDVSRSRIQKWIEDGNVLVNDEKVKCNYKLRLGDVVSCEIPEAVEYEVTAEDIPLDIVYEDHDILVVNKPRGMVIHPAPGNLSGTLVNALLFHCNDLSGINGVMRPGIVHRIDKDTSGLLVVAKNDKAHVSLSEQLKDKTVSRKYYALVHGVLPHDVCTIDAPIGRDEKDRQKMAVTAKNSRYAKTHVHVVERYKDASLVECILETGRTHQIRVHMEYIKYPLVGDPKYSYRSTPEVGGQLLHAHELTLIHPTTKEAMTFHAEMPDIMKEAIEKVKNGGVKAIND
ncbi:MAG: RluA family pseudouridine synthase [Erysipelotrichaceae bacterium]|nr:RluA family pseudouridine synthase [Erysipelotrichaceae bacterium]